MDYEVEPRRLDQQSTATVRARVPQSQISRWLSAAFDEVFGHISHVGATPAGPPFARFEFVDGEFEIEAGVPVSEPVQQRGWITPSTLPAGEAAVTLHVGSYESIGAAHTAIEDWIREQDCVPAGPAWESYLSDPDVEPDQLRTEVVEPFTRN